MSPSESLTQAEKLVGDAQMLLLKAAAHFTGDARPAFDAADDRLHDAKRAIAQLRRVATGGVLHFTTPSAR